MKQIHYDIVVAHLEKTLGKDFKNLSKDMDHVVYENEHIRIATHYLTSGSDKSILISIKKLGENKSYFFGEYLEHIGEKDIRPKNDENDAHFINRYLDAFRSHYEGSLKEVISGKKWIDVPRNYGIYR